MQFCFVISILLLLSYLCIFQMSTSNSTNLVEMTNSSVALTNNFVNIQSDGKTRSDKGKKRKQYAPRKQRSDINQTHSMKRDKPRKLRSDIDLSHYMPIQPRSDIGQSHNMPTQSRSDIGQSHYMPIQPRSDIGHSHNMPTQPRSDINQTHNMTRQSRSHEIENINYDAKNFAKMYDTLTQFEICGVCSLEGGEMILKQDCEDIIANSGLAALYDERKRYFSQGSFHAKFKLDIEHHLENGILKNSTHICKSCIRYMSGKVKSQSKTGKNLSICFASNVSASCKILI